MSVEEGTHTLADGKKLFTKTFRVQWSLHHSDRH